MQTEHGRIDRRTLLKVMGSVGATATIGSACRTVENTVSAQGLTGGKFEKTVALATAGPGGNRAWQPGDAVKFLPPEDIPTRGKAADLVASLPKEKVLHLWDRMTASRRWETAMKDLFLSGKDGLYGAFHTYVGEEAVANGVISTLNENDYIASTHRGHGHLIAKGGDLNKMSAEIFFKESGYNKGYGGSMHITDMSKGIMGMNGIVGASFYMAAGAAIRSMVQKTNQVAVAFFGDGASASPYYFSAIRSCANQKVPCVFVNENNFQYMQVPMAFTVPTKYISEYTKGLDIPHFLVDGNDVTAVYAAAKEAVDWARAGKGPSMIEAITYRWYDHAGFAGGRVNQDAAMGLPYRTDEEVRGWMSRDPIPRFKKWILAKGIASEAELTDIEKKNQAAVEASIEFARKSADPAPEAGVLNTYAKGAAVATQFYNRKGLASQPRLT
jgi:acetoin:2,6-dichlorophenolindophenol oxidoreductase subunit alpha